MSATINSNSPKYSKGDYVRIKTQNEFGFVKTVTKSPHGVFFYEIENIDNSSKYIAEEQSVEQALMQVTVTGGGSWTPLQIDNWDDGRGANQWISGLEDHKDSLPPAVPAKPKCECGLHAVDPSRSFGHSSWCPIATELRP